LTAHSRPHPDAPSALLLPDDLYRSLTDAVVDPLIVVDDQQRIVLFNRAAEEVFGYESAAVIGRDLNLLVPDRHQQSHSDHMRRFATLNPEQQRRPSWMRARVEGRRGDGSVFPAEVSLSAVEVDGQTLMVAELRDVTARVEMEQALEASERRFRATFENSPVAMVLISDQGDFITGNNSFYEQTGYSSDDLAGRWLGSIVQQKDRAALAESLRPVITGDADSARIEVRYQRKDGVVRAIDLSVATASGSGADTYMIGQATDITGRIETQERLQEMIRSKDELIASISHELRTPLTALVGIAHLLQEDESGLDPEERSEMIELIVSESVDLTNIVDDLLVAARAEIGALRVARVATDLHAQIAQILELWNRTDIAPIKTVGRPARVWGDPARVRQILRNLVSNAIRYGGAPITVEVLVRDMVGVVAVSDRGEEIPPEDQARIFEPYERAHQAEGLTASMGLGLSISRALASLMDGRLEYHYIDGMNVFELRLPLAESAD
jgi:PAS domain S-box-containing protein